MRKADLRRRGLDGTPGYAAGYFLDFAKAPAGINPTIKTIASNGTANDPLILSVAKRSMTTVCSTAANWTRSSTVAPLSLGWSVIFVLQQQPGCAVSAARERRQRWYHMNAHQEFMNAKPSVEATE